YAYAPLGAHAQATEHSLRAVQAFAAETERIDQSLAAIRAGRLLDAILANDTADQAGWYWQLRELPDAPEPRYLYHLLATHEFQEGLNNYRDLRLMQRTHEAWSLSVAAFDDRVDMRQRAYAARLPAMQATLDGVDLDALEERKVALEARVAAIERDGDIAGLATARELEQWHKVERIAGVLAQADPSDPLVADMQD